MKPLILFTVLAISSPLIAEEVSVSVGGKKLQGELSAAGKNDSQVVFILSGSGPTDMDGNTLGAPGKNNSLKYLSDFLNKEGVATLRVDKRGVGSSANAVVKESDLRFGTYVEDAERWIGFLEKRGYSEIVLIGHSEGALVATLVASSEAVAGLVCIAGAGRPVPDILREQLKPKLPESLYARADKVISTLTEGKTVEDVPPELNALFRPSVQPYLISWFGIDPAKAISEVKVPTLIIQGTTDLQTSRKDAERLHAEAEGSKLVIVEGMNHVLKKVEGDLAAQTASYFDPDLPLHEDLGTAVLSFLKTTRTAPAEEGDKSPRTTEP